MLNKGTYSSDIIDGFEQMQITLPNDYEGKVITTIIRKLTDKKSNKAVLYIHGFQDYFFQTELAEQFNNYGYNFYAVDLRKSGRSLLPHQIPYNMRDINEFFEDLNIAIQQIKKEGNVRVIINAHSTGGLIASLYLDEYKNACDVLILNSPFLEMNKRWWTRKIGIPVLSCFSKLFPKIKIHGGFSPFYGQSISNQYNGEWSYNLEWKPIRAEYVTITWLSAIYKAHKKIKQKLNIICPILVMSSNKSIKSKTWTDTFKQADAVLNVNHIQKYAYYLGNNITATAIKNGMHDLILSAKPVRYNVYSVMFNWLAEHNI